MIKIIKQQKDDILNSRRPAPLDALAQAQVQAQAQNGGGGVRSPELFNSLFEYNNLIMNFNTIIRNKNIWLEMTNKMIVIITIENDIKNKNNYNL